MSVPTGQVYSFTLRSSDSKIYSTVLVRVEPYFDCINQFGQTAPGDFSTMLVPNCFASDVKYCGEAGTWTRKVLVYVPRQVSGNKAVYRDGRRQLGRDQRTH